MNPALHPDPDDLVLYCMQSLDSTATAQVHAHLQECAECAASAAEFRTDMALLALASPRATPPPAARQRLLDAAMAETQAARPKIVASTPAASNLATFPPRRTSVATWVGWAAAIASVFYIVHVRKTNDSLNNLLQTETAEVLQLDQTNARAQEILDVLTSPQAQRVALVPGKTAPAPNGHAVYLKDRGALVFTATNLAPLPPNKIYELWVIPANGSAPIPAGTFAPDTRGSASLLLPKLPIGVEAKAFGVTMENEGGATTPTMPILLAGG